VSPAIATPPFLLWAVGYQCPIRGFQDGSDPERTERQLRAAVATSEARREGRVFEGYGVAPPLAFRIEEALALYGGAEQVEETCRGCCPANAVAMHQAGALAGCVGMFALPTAADDFHERVETAIVGAGLAEACSRYFPATRPRWHGLWMQASSSAEQVDLLANIVDALNGAFEVGESLKMLSAGLWVARDRQLPFHTVFYPSGRVENGWWVLVGHCPKCKAEWKSMGTGRCETCNYEGHPAPDKKRRARGRRPYMPLERLMGAEKAAEFLKRYGARVE
jgi:hypothetical protein